MTISIKIEGLDDLLIFLSKVKNPEEWTVVDGEKGDVIYEVV